MCISYKNGTSNPVIGCAEVISVDELKFIEYFRFEWIVVHRIDNNSSFSLETEWSLINIYNEHKLFHDVHAGDMFCWGIVGSIYKGFTCSVDSCVEINLGHASIGIFTSGESIVIDPAVLYSEATLSIQGWGKDDELFNRAVVSHFYNGLVLLDESSVNWESVVFHVVYSK